MSVSSTAAIGVFAIIYILILLVALAFSAVSYIFQSLGLYTVAKRRGLNNPWLAWLPVGNTWILGSISDGYQQAAKNRIKNRRKVLLGLNIAVYAMYIPFYILYFVLIIANPQPSLSDTTFILPFMALMAVTLAMLAISITFLVLLYFAYYDLFASCDPSNAVAFIIVSIFFSFALPFIIFIIRNKDLGMPVKEGI